MMIDKSITILVAEDEYLVSKDIIRILKMQGYAKILEADDGEDAYEKTCSLRPDVVLMDILMPKLDGIEAARKIQDRCPTPIVMITAYETSDFLIRAVGAGVSAFLTKPPQPEEIRRAIVIALARHADLMEVRRLNKDIKLLLKEKEVLIKEVYHRVKNNFSVVSSLLNLQADEIEDNNYKEIFIQSRDRINSMALIHERLYKSQDLVHINFAEYIKNLSSDLYQAYNTSPERISIVTEVEDIILDVDKVIPCGLVVNELISNALKFAFPKEWTGKGIIKVTLHRSKKNEIELKVKDNGIGLPKNFDINKSKTLGMKIITILIESQLQGRLNIKNQCGVEIQIHFASNELIK